MACIYNTFCLASCNEIAFVMLCTVVYTHACIHVYSYNVLKLD